MFLGYDARYEYIGDDGETCWILTNMGERTEEDGSWPSISRRSTSRHVGPRRGARLPDRGRGHLAGGRGVDAPPVLGQELLPEDEYHDRKRSTHLGGKLVVRTTCATPPPWSAGVPQFDGNAERPRFELPGSRNRARGFHGGLTPARYTFYSFTNFLQPRRRSTASTSKTGQERPIYRQVRGRRSTRPSSRPTRSATRPSDATTDDPDVPHAPQGPRSWTGQNPDLSHMERADTTPR